MSTLAEKQEGHPAHIDQVDRVEPYVAERQVECTVIDDARRLAQVFLHESSWAQMRPREAGFSRCSSMSLCIRPNGNAVSRRASKPENLITWRTPAALAASINVFCVSTISMRGAEIMRTRSTPSSADSKLLGLDMSPSTICTVGALSSPFAFALLRTKIRTGTCSRTNSSVMNEPANPVAPVRRIIAISLRFHSPAGSGPRRLSIGLRTQDVWSREIESP